MLWSLLRPFSYLTISHSRKKVVDWWCPLALAVISTAIIMLLRLAGSVEIFSPEGLVEKVLGFVQSLPGFYIAALAAIATFNKNDIDKIMPDPAPTIDIQLQGKNVNIELTRRRFLSLMFAFLTAESFLIIILSIFAVVFSGSLRAIINPVYHEVLVGGFVLLYLTMMWQMIVTSFWGLFYLGDRLHQPD